MIQISCLYHSCHFSSLGCAVLECQEPKKKKELHMKLESGVIFNLNLHCCFIVK